MRTIRRLGRRKCLDAVLSNGERSTAEPCSGGGDHPLVRWSTFRSPQVLRSSIDLPKATE